MALDIPLRKTNLGQKNILFIRPSIRNKLSNDLKTLNTTTSFTQNYKKLDLKNLSYHIIISTIIFIIIIISPLLSLLLLLLLSLSLSLFLLLLSVLLPLLLLWLFESLLFLNFPLVDKGSGGTLTEIRA